MSFNLWTNKEVLLLMTNISGRYKKKNFEAEYTCIFCQHQQQQLEKQTSKSLESMIPDFMFFLEFGSNSSHVRPAFIFLYHSVTITEQELVSLSLSHV
jgi:hypothetical protein